MSEAGKEQSRTEQPVDVSEYEWPRLTQEQRKFLEMLHSVLPVLVTEPKKPLGDPSPLPAQEPAQSPDRKEIQDGVDSGGDQEERLLKAKRELEMACWGLFFIISKFKVIDKRICAVEGGAQLMYALVELNITTDSYLRITPEDIYMAILSLEKASDELVEAFKKLGEGFIKDKHLAPLRGLSGSCSRKRQGSLDERELLKLCLNLKEHMDNVTKSLSEVFESELPEFLKAREEALSIDYNNMLTAATFFSAVTATTLQLSYAYNTSSRASLGVAVNTLWFVALVFSTASSLNSLVGLTWYQKIRRIQILPDWVKLWIEYGPTISLAVASAAFSAGLCLFAFSSSQHTITTALTATFTIAHAVVLFVPLCLYSPNLGFLMKEFTRSLGVPTWLFSMFWKACLRRWYLRKVPRQDRDPVAYFMFDRNWTKANVIEAQHLVEMSWPRERESKSETEPTEATPSTGDAGPDSSSSLIGMVKRKFKNAWLFARFVVAWPMTRRPDWPTLRRRKASATREPNNIEQVQDPDVKVATRSKLERDIESQGDTGEPELQKPIVTESQSTAPFQRPRTQILDATDPDRSVAIASKGSSEEAGRRFDTHPTLESAKEPVATTSSTTDPIPGLSSSQTVRNSDNCLEDVERQETDAPRRFNQLQKDEPRPPSCSPLREGAEENNVGTSNSASGVGRGHGRIVLEGCLFDQD